MATTRVSRAAANWHARTILIHGRQNSMFSPTRSIRGFRTVIAFPSDGPYVLVWVITGLAFSALKMANSGRNLSPWPRNDLDSVTSSWLTRSLYRLPGSFNRTFTLVCVNVGRMDRTTA